MPTDTPTPTPTPTATATPTMGAADMTFVIDSRIGLRGETTTIDVVLRTALEVVETQNEIIILGSEIRFATDANGQPICTVNPGIDMNATFTLACDEAGFCTLRALVFSSGNPDPIPDGSVLYSCEIGVALNAPPGTYPLVCATSANQELSAACVDGSIVVGEVPTASPTPTQTPLPPPATVTITVTPTETSSLHPGYEDHDGCRATAPGGTHRAWLLALPIVLLWRRRRLGKSPACSSQPRP